VRRPGVLGRRQVERCLREADVTKLRNLTTGSLYRLHVLAKAYALAWPAADARETSLRLLPLPLRSRVQ